MCAVDTLVKVLKEAPESLLKSIDFDIFFSVQWTRW